VQVFHYYYDCFDLFCMQCAVVFSVMLYSTLVLIELEECLPGGGNSFLMGMFVINFSFCQSFTGICRDIGE
jgi:hypothetical protein